MMYGTMEKKKKFPRKYCIVASESVYTPFRLALVEPLKRKAARSTRNSLRDKQSVQAMMQAMCTQIQNATAICAHRALSRLHIHDLYIHAAEIKRLSKMARSEHEYTTVATLTFAATTRRCTSKSRNAKESEVTLLSVRSCSATLAIYIKRGKK